MRVARTGENVGNEALGSGKSEGWKFEWKMCTRADIARVSEIVNHHNGMQNRFYRTDQEIQIRGVSELRMCRPYGAGWTFNLAHEELSHRTRRR
jgi:hypothetical protein